MRALLLVLVAASAAAQPAPTDAWLSGSGGFALAQQAGPTNDFYGSFAGHLAAPPYAVRLAYTGMDRFRYDFSGFLSFAQVEGAVLVEPEPSFNLEPDSYQTLSLGVGPLTQTDRLSGVVTVGPAVTWGEDAARGYDTFVRVGLGLTAQGAVRALGPLWAGVEASAVWNDGASHLGAGLTLRVDIARPAR